MEKPSALKKPPSWGAGGEPLGPYEEVTLHGHTVGFQAAGEGPLLVLLHGITSTSDPASLIESLKSPSTPGPAPGGTHGVNPSEGSRPCQESS